MEEEESQDPLLGTSIFGTYEVSQKLGEGAMGAVYLAKRDDTQQRVALKVLHERTLDNEETVQRFHREARVISMLSHPNIVRVFVYGETKGSPYMAMEFVEGTSLSQVLRDGPISEKRVIAMGRQLCSAIGEAHDLGILHRDIKPENILLTNYRGRDDYVKVLDFGLAKITGSNSNLTQSGIVYGTPAYMSPEQAQALDLDPRSDIYSVGCTLYHMVTGDVPFEGKTAVRTLEMQVFQEATPPSKHADVSAEFEEVILRALQKKPEDRFPSADAMLRALEALDETSAGSDDLARIPTAAPDWLPVEKLNDLALKKPWFWPAALGALAVLAFGMLLLFVILIVVIL